MRISCNSSVKWHRVCTRYRVQQKHQLINVVVKQRTHRVLWMFKLISWVCWFVTYLVNFTGIIANAANVHKLLQKYTLHPSGNSNKFHLWNFVKTPWGGHCSMDLVGYGQLEISLGASGPPIIGLYVCSFSGKLVKFVKDFKDKMHQTRFPFGLCPRPHWGAYSAPLPLDPLAVSKRPTSKERKGRGRK